MESTVSRKDVIVIGGPTASGKTALSVELAKRIIEQKGIVYGAVFNEDCDVVHEEINKIEDIEKLKGSKYVQSNIGDTYKKIEEKLKEKFTF